ncbi:MAG: DoxX family protein [Pirellulaceae bacterium]|nr:DoxX family protein [Pirellulaceae bacterium]
MRRSNVELFVLGLLRIGVGWHFAYEGLSKLFDGNWSSAGYLESTNWIGADLFHWMAANPTVLKVVDVSNIWGLILVGGALMLGCLTRVAAALGIAMLALYYAAHPSLFADPSGMTEGTYLFVNKNLVELLALCVVAVLPAGRFGLDGLLFAWRRRSVHRGAACEPPADLAEPAFASPLGRRQVLASFLGVPFVGGFVWAVLKKRGYESHEENQLAARIDGLSGATMKPFEVKTVEDLKGPIDTAKICNVRLSRLILGGNLMNGFAHARDLIYVSNLIRAYHYPEKIFETFRLAEACGVNTVLTNPRLAPMITEYRKREFGKIQFIAQCKGNTEKDLLESVRYSIDNGACAAYVQGEAADSYVRDGKFGTIEKALELMRAGGLPAGIGGHRIRTIKLCIDQGLESDFWVKTLHHHMYWSADVENQQDNIWCEDPHETITFMNDLPQPWIAFKVLAAGAINPRSGFKYAFRNGADFICVGMYDFQIVDDVNVALTAIKEAKNRVRPWQAV